MLVKDPSGLTLGPITRVGQTADGATAVEVAVDGRRVSLSPSILSLNASGDGATSSMSKAEIQAAQARAPE
jgi:sRNA-binding protein